MIHCYLSAVFHTFCTTLKYPFVALMATILVTLPGSAQSGPRNHQAYAPGELLVRFNQTASHQEIQSIREQYGCEIIRWINLVDVFHLKINSEQSVETVVARFRSHPLVEFAHPNHPVYASQRALNNAERWPDNNPDDTFKPTHANYGKQWSLDNWKQTGGTVDADIDAPQMWRMATNSDVVVAIVDTGVEWYHDDLETNIWQNTNEAIGDLNNDGFPGVAGVDDDGDGLIDEDSLNREPGDVGYNNDLANDDDENGFVDDIRGWNFVDSDNDPDDFNGHGTHVAGIVGGVGNNGKGIAGVCWKVPLMAVRVLGANGVGSTADVVAGVCYAIENGAQIINLSLGGFFDDPTFEAAITVADLMGVLVVAAAGNDDLDIDIPGNEFYPASYPQNNLITVAASNHADKRWRWGLNSGSNWGADSVDLAAPGENIYSTYLLGGYETLTGTSMAAPHVSGVAALCWQLDPGLSHIDLRTDILNGAFSFHAADKEKKEDFRLGAIGEVVTEGRLRAPCNADYGDAPDGPFPTFWPVRGAIHLDSGLEWLGNHPSVERGAFDVFTDTDGIPNLVNNDGFDDGVQLYPPYFCKNPAFDRVDVMVSVSDPTAGRYDLATRKLLHLNSFFDFNGDGDWQDIFTCVVPNDAPEHLLIQAVGGPGAFSVVNALPADHLEIDPSLWGPPGTQQSMVFELFFHSPPKPLVADSFFTRFRLEYDDALWPSADPFPGGPKNRGNEFDYSLFGEVEDYPVSIGGFHLATTGLIAGGVTTFTMTEATPNGLIGLAYSLAGGGPFVLPVGPCAGINIHLSPPFSVLAMLNADLAGGAVFNTLIPPGAAGVTVWIQALDIPSCLVSNQVVEVIQ